MNNIFKNAYFGKAYKTRDGKKALYWRYDGHYHSLITDNNCPFQPWCDEAGKDHGWKKDAEESPLDIISEWNEEINEEELDELAEHWCPESGIGKVILKHKESLGMLIKQVIVKLKKYDRSKVR